ncbi:permease [Paenibacillus ginsengihumi]|uniref:permease n=1 Tax=Paenibacillus ginsengihumi TaxID=431596 RepID=UPI00035ECB50|nr:permease [Paenibacillus ginsengihumi]
MPASLLRWGPALTALLCLVLLGLIIADKPLPDLSFLQADGLQNFKTLFLSIILEAFPFVLLGVLVSALLQMFVSEQTLRRLMPKNPLLGIGFACVAGLIFPLCECGMIPVIRRLMRKGMPVYIAVVFILVGPIINPVVFASTFMAFRSRPEIAYSRMALAFIVAFAIGWLVYKLVRTNPLRLAGANSRHGQPHRHDHGPVPGGIQSRAQPDRRPAALHAGHDHRHPHDHHHDHAHAHGAGFKGKVTGVLGHASDEFFDMGKYLIFGAMLTALIQTLVARESLVAIGQGEFSSHLFMMGLAYVLSLCSTSDAFVASSFTTTFSTGSLLTFLVFGPMLDIKGTLMLLSAFRARFVLLMSALVIVVVLAASLLFERLFFA